jgi:hypothetical protein
MTVKTLEARVRRLEDARGARGRMIDICINRFGETDRAHGDLQVNGEWLKRRASESDADYRARAFSMVQPVNQIRLIMRNACEVSS